MRLLRIVKKILLKIKNHIFNFRLLGALKLQKDGIDESVLEQKIPELNGAAEEYFLAQKNNFREEMKKPFLVDNSASRMLVKLGWIFSELEYCKNLTVLDFGCGLGWLSYYMNRLGFNTIGIDVSKTALEYADSQFDKHEFYNPLHNYHFLHYDGYKFPVSDCSVHYIITFDAFHHVPNQAKILKEMHRVLVPGGKLILSEPGTGHALSEQTKEEIRKYNVLERDTNILDFEEKALNAGFKEIYLKPFFYDIDFKLRRKEYHRFFKGYLNMEIIHSIRNTMIINPMIVCEKDGSFEKSMFHKAHTKADIKNIQIKPGEKFDFNLNVENTGQIVFPTKQHKNGGFVTIGCRLFKEDKMLKEDVGGRILFDRDLPPGEKKDFNITRTAPEEPGDYILRIEPVYECFYWFSEKGSDSAEIHLKVK